jgi:hypothetical protein
MELFFIEKFLLAVLVLLDLLCDVPWMMNASDCSANQFNVNVNINVNIIGTAVWNILGN